MNFMDRTKINYKKVPAIEKCFNLLEILSRTDQALGISEIARRLGYHKGTVYNMVYTLLDLGILEQTQKNKFRLGARLYSLGRAAGNSSELIRTVHPFLEDIHRKLHLSAYLGVLVGDHVVTMDKVDSPIHLKVSSEIGLSTHILVGAVGKIILSKMSDKQIKEILSRYELKPYTPYSIVDKGKFMEMIRKTREDGYAYSNQEYIEGIRALAVPLNNYKQNLMTAIYILGLNSQIQDKDVASYGELLKQTARTIDERLAMS